MNWDDYRFFLAVARKGKLKAASALLNVDQATVGRRITALHQRLGATLLEKRSSGYFLTAAGARVLANVERMENEMLLVDRAILGKDDRIEGPVKIAMPAAFADQWLLEKFRPLLAKHPGLELQFVTGPEVLNLSRREADFAIRLLRPEQRDLKMKRLGHFRLGLFCAKDFTPPSPLAEAPFVGLFDSAMSDPEKAFLQALKFDPRYCLRTSSWSAVRAGIRARLGVGILPSFLSDRDSQLQPLQKGRAELPLWLVVHPEVARSARVRAAMDLFSTLLPG